MNRHLVEQDVQPARSLEEVDPRRTKALLPLSMLGQTDNGVPKRGVGPPQETAHCHADPSANRPRHSYSCSASTRLAKAP